MKNLLAALTVILTSTSAPSQVLYNINFDPPDQQADSLVRIGSAPNFVSSINFGQPTVVNSFGGLNQQPLKFDMVGNDLSFYYDQIGLDLSSTTPAALDLSFDFTSLGLIGPGSNRQFVVLFDTPQVVTMSFDSKGNIVAHNFGPDITIGKFADGETFRCDFHVDLSQHTWSFSTNGVSVSNLNILSSGSSVHAIRFSYGLQSSLGAPDYNSTAAIDNVIVTAIPEPRLSLLLLSALAIWQTHARFRRHHHGQNLTT